MADEPRTVDQLTSQELFESTRVQPPEPAPEPAPEPVPVEPPQPAATPAAVPAEPAESIPSWRLREEAEGRRLAEERARLLETRLQEIATHLQQQQKQPDFFDDPNVATRAAVLSMVQPWAEETRKTLMHMGRMVASAVHGADKVEEAEQAFLTARANESLDPVDYERVVQSPNRYDAVVQWHRRQSVLASVGDDPDAWFEKQLEARMSDPQFQAKVLEKVRGGAASRPSETRLPPSLSRTTAVASSTPAPIGDMSDKSLFEYAMGKGRSQ